MSENDKPAAEHAPSSGPTKLRLDPKCPLCDEPLTRVVQESNSPLNHDQWASTIAGNWFCTCHNNHRGNKPYAYYWDNEFRRDSVAAGAPSSTEATRCPTCNSDSQDMHWCAHVAHPRIPHAYIRHECVCCHDSWHKNSRPVDSKGEGSQPPAYIFDTTCAHCHCLYSLELGHVCAASGGERSAGKPEECPTCGSIRRDVRGYHVPSRQDCRDPWHDAPLSPATQKKEVMPNESKLSTTTDLSGAALKTYFYEAYDAGRRSMKEEAAKAANGIIETLRMECRTADENDEVSRAMDLGDRIRGAMAVQSAIRSLADGGQK